MQSAIGTAEVVIGFSETGIVYTESTFEEPACNTPSTLVLQAHRQITKENSAAFQQAIESALEAAIEGVIIDLLWAENIDASGVTALVAATEKAAVLGKILSFQSMNHQTRLAVESEWEQHRQKRFGSRTDRFNTNLEQFLGKGRRG